MLLDTNAFIRFVEGEKRLKEPLRSAIADPAIPVSVSISSFWEMTIKHRKGKLPLPAPFDVDPVAAFEGWCERGVIDILPIAPRHIAAAMALDWPHDDPFDRLIAATAIVENEELVTSDKELAACPGVRVIKV